MNLRTVNAAAGISSHYSQVTICMWSKGGLAAQVKRRPRGAAVLASDETSCRIVSYCLK
jgi:hypothetical protein